MSAPKGLNYTESQNRYRFEKLSERLQRVNVDVIHRVNQTGALDVTTTVPDTGNSGCFFQDELENLKDLHVSSTFKRFYYEIWPLVQSLAELLHNLPKVIKLLTSHLEKPEIESVAAFLQLLAVLARDVQDDMFPHFHGVFRILVGLVDKTSSCGENSLSKGSSPDPGLTGKVFECMSHLIRYQLPLLTDDPDSLRQYYGPLVGHKTDFVREFAAQMFSVFLRKLSVKNFKSHMRRLLRALGSSCRVQDGRNGDASAADLPVLQVENSRKPVPGTPDLPARVTDLLQGVSQLLFCTFKGVKGCLHSKGGKLLSVPLSLLPPLPSQSVEEILSLSPSHRSGLLASSLSAKTQKSLFGLTAQDAMFTTSSCRVAAECIRRLFRHMHPANTAELWLRTLDAVEGVTNVMRAFYALSEPSEELSVCVEICAAHTIEIMLFSLCHSGGRAISDEDVKEALHDKIIAVTLEICDNCLRQHRGTVGLSSRLSSRARVLLCKLWRIFPRDKILVKRIKHSLGLALVVSADNEASKSIGTAAVSELSEGVKIICQELLLSLPRDVMTAYLLQPLLGAITQLQSFQSQNKMSTEHISWPSLLYIVFVNLVDNRECVDGSRFSVSNGSNEVNGNSSGRYSGVLMTCSKEIQFLLGACVDILSCRKSFHADDGDRSTTIAACLALAWAADVSPTFLTEKSVRSNMLKLVASLSDNVIPELLMQERCGTHVMLAYATKLLCALCRVYDPTDNNCPYQISSADRYLRTVVVSSYVDLLYRNPKSMTLLWGLLSVLGCIIGSSADVLENPMQREILSTLLMDGRVDKLLEAIGKSLLTPSYWLRICALRVLSFLPAPAQVMQRRSKPALSMDEDPDEQADFTEKCVYDVAKLCLEAASLPASIRLEREYSRRMTHLDMLIKSGKIPAEYTRIVSSFSLGMFHYKFMPLWEPASSVLVGALATEEGEQVTWPLILSAIKDLSYRTTITTVGEDFDQMSMSDYLECLEAVNSGECSLSMDLATSPLFFFAARRSQEFATVEPDSRTDVHTAYNTLWGVFQKSPSITMRHSRVVVPMFIRFLEQQYYATFVDDPELSTLYRSGVFSLPATDSESAVSDEKLPELAIPVLKKRLLLFLKVFAAVSSPRQLFHHQALYRYFCTIMSKPDNSITKLALECILTYKPPAVMPYKDNLKNILDDTKLRNEMLSFNPDIKGGSISVEHREIFIPILMSVMYGRFVSKSKGSKTARDQGLARRNAVLSFMSKFPAQELDNFIHLMIRGIIPREKIMARAQSGVTDRMDSFQNDVSVMAAWHADVVDLVLSDMQVDDVLEIPWERQIGFLYLLEQAVKLLGHGLSPYVHILNRLVVLFLNSSHKCAGDDSKAQIMDTEDESEDESDSSFAPDTVEVISVHDNAAAVNRVQSSKVRAMCLRRLAELVERYESDVDFTAIISNVWHGLESLLVALPGSISGSMNSNSKAPAMLRLLYSLVQFESTIDIVASRDDIVKVIIQCIAAHRCSGPIVGVVMNTLSSLLEHRGGSVILHHSELIIECFSKRFMGPEFNAELSDVKLSELNINPSGSVKEELKLLSSIATNFFSRKDVRVSNKSVSNLATLLLGMLRTYTTSKKVRVEEDWVLNILRIYKSLLWRVDDVKAHVPLISRLFGPASHSFSLFNVNVVRSELVLVYGELAEHESTDGLLRPSYRALSKLTAFDTKLIDSRNFSECMPVFQSLSGEAVSTAGFDCSWEALLGPSHCQSTKDMSLCCAIIFECLRCMSDSELVIRSAALAALKMLMSSAAKWSGICPCDTVNSPLPARMDIVKVIVIPGLRRGLKHTSDTCKKGYVHLLSHIIKNIGVHCSRIEDVAMFHSDLNLIGNDDPEQDFFENICHIQLHRRTRIMLKLRNQLAGYSETEIPFGASSLVHVLLPLAMHPLISEDFSKKDHMPLLQESASLVGEIARHLRWTQYYGLIKHLLKCLGHDRLDKEKVLLVALCAVLDSFHFSGSGCADDVPGESGKSVDNLESFDDKEEKGNEDDTCNLIEEQSPQPGSRNIHSIVMKSIIPWVKAFLIKEGKDHSGNKTQSVRTLVAVALTKLLNRLHPPAVTEDKKANMFTNLVINIVNTLKSRDSAARDMARDSLSQMVSTMGIESFSLVLNELHHMLGDGYQRHVRNYTVRSMMSVILKDYKPPVNATSVPILDMDAVAAFKKEEFILPAFDKCIPVLVGFCMDDIDGITHEDRHTDGAVRTLIREAKGNKANEVLEMCGECILFRPSYALCSMDDPAAVSSIHALVTPLLESLRTTESSGAFGRCSEALQRVAIGLARNPSVDASELLLYLHATLNPFVSKIVSEKRKRKSVLGKVHAAEESSDDELTGNIPSYLRDESSDEDEAPLYSKRLKKDSVSGVKANTWLPFDSVKGQREAIQKRQEEQRMLTEIQDGALAPRLTGRNKYKAETKQTKEKSVGDDPAFNSAVKFCLSLLLSCLKQNRLDSKNEQIRSMASPFLPLLGQCLRVAGNSTVVVLAMRCICALLNWGLPVDISYSRSVGKRMLGMMYKGGAVLSSDSDLVQTCIKGMVSLFQLYNSRTESSETVDEKDDETEENGFTASMTPKKKAKLPLDEQNIRALLSLLTSSILEVTSEYQNSAFQLIRMIVDAKVVVPEIYDLITRLVEQIVLSHRKGVRETASNIVVSFLISYPLGKKRLDAHMRQFVQNCSYEYEEGRVSALSLLIDLCRLLPVPVVDEYSQLIFMPMALQLVNDQSPKCRARAGDVIVSLCRRASADTVSNCLTFSMQWLGVKSKPNAKSMNRSLMRTGAQAMGLIVLARADLFKRGTIIPDTLLMIRETVFYILKADGSFGQSRRQSLEKREMSKDAEGDGESGGGETWAMLYHLLVLLERVFTHLPAVVDKTIVRDDDSGGTAEELPPLMEIVQESMLYPHAWVRAAACRTLALYLQRRDPTAAQMGCVNTSSELLMKPNGLYNMARRLCVAINQPVIAPTLLPALIDCLVFGVRAMHHYPDTNLSSGADESGDESDNSDEASDEKKDGALSVSSRSSVGGSNWVMHRLRAIGADSRGSRRANVIKVFSRLIKAESVEFVKMYLYQFIEVALRSRISKRDRSESNDENKELLETCVAFLDDIEAVVGSSLYIGVYGEVQRAIESSKAEKKRRLAAEAISDPKSYAQRKVEKSEKKKESRKRKAEKFAAAKGLKRKKNSRVGAVIYEDI